MKNKYWFIIILLAAIILGVTSCDILFGDDDNNKSGSDNGGDSNTFNRELSGDVIGLTILVEFPDLRSPFSREMIDEHLNRKGGIGGDNSVNNGSVYDYFYDVSGGLFKFTNIVTPWIITDHNREYYNNVSRGDLIREVLGKLEEMNFDVSGLTARENEAVALSIYYVGPSTGIGQSGGWFGTGTARPVVGGVFFRQFQVSNIPITSDPTISLFIHESCHMLFNWPDLYSGGAATTVVYGYCMMSSGRNSNNPPVPSPLIRDMAGWLDVTDITGMNETILTITANSNSAFYFSRNAYEGYYIEARRRTGRNANIPDEGLFIWHIDRRGSNSSFNPDNPFPRAKVVRANDPDNTNIPFPPTPPNNAWNNAAFRAGGGSNNVSFNSTSSPAARWHDGTLSDINITEISAVGDVMSFRITNANSFVKVNGVPYIDGNDKTQIADNVTVIDNNNINRIGILDGWYLVRGNLQRNSSLNVSGAAHVILENGSSLTVTGSSGMEWISSMAGINVSMGNSLSIYAQSANANVMGSITATGSDSSAGIGGNIGGSRFLPARMRAGGTITINGGNITATGGAQGAGIGGGGSGAGGTITINGGNITATGGNQGAGIGGGTSGAGGTITINGGTVTATRGHTQSAGIGPGRNAAGNGGTLTMSGNAVVFASSLRNNNVEINISSVTNGIIFNGTAGTFYGRNITISQNVTIPARHTLTIPAGAVLTVPAGISFINNGTIIENGTIRRQ